MTLPYEHCVNIIQTILENTVKSDKMYKYTRFEKIVYTQDFDLQHREYRYIIFK